MGPVMCSAVRESKSAMNVKRSTRINNYESSSRGLGRASNSDTTKNHQVMRSNSRSRSEGVLSYSLRKKKVAAVEVNER